MQPGLTYCPAMQYYAVCMQKSVIQPTDCMEVIISIPWQIKILVIQEIHSESRCQAAVSFEVQIPC